jgi:hypothetical protein
MRSVKYMVPMHYILEHEACKNTLSLLRSAEIDEAVS